MVSVCYSFHAHLLFGAFMGYENSQITNTFTNQSCKLQCTAQGLTLTLVHNIKAWQKIQTGI